MSAILIYASTKEKTLSAQTREILGMARKLSDPLNSRVTAALVGEKISFLGPELIASGADLVCIAEDECLAEFQANLYLKVLQEITSRIRPGLMIFPGDAQGTDLATRLAYRLKAGLVTDCTDFSFQDGGLILTKPVYGSKALARVKVNTPVSLVTVRPRTQEPFPRDPRRIGETRAMLPDLAHELPETVLVERVEEKSAEINLEDARVVVSGGRGIGGAQAFQQIRELAQILGGAVGASRAAVDAGWVPASCQVGQTGKIVGPDLYLAIGISGSSQHAAGMSGSKIIAAINRDPEAPIFRLANVGVVEDYRNVLPAFTAELKKMLGK